MTTQENVLEAAVPAKGPSFRGALASRDFSLLFAGQLTSEVGNGLIQLALPWLVLKLTDSALQLGVAYFFQFLPMLLFGIVGGVFADRYDRRLTIITVDVIRAVAFLSVGAIYYLGALTAIHLYAVIFIESTLQNFFNPARAALLPNLVSKENLRAANSLSELSRHIGFIVATPTGGLMVAVLGPAAIMLFNGGSFVISALAVFMIGWRQPTRDAAPSEGWQKKVSSGITQAADGLRAIGRQRMLQVTLLLGLGLNLIIAPIQVLIPLFVDKVRHSGSEYFALLVVGLLVGSVIGSLTAPATARKIGLGRMTILSVLALGIVITFATLPPSPWPPVFAMAVAGAAVGLLNVAQTTMLQGATTDEERGRVSATYFTVTLGVRPISFLAMGALAEGVDIRLLFVVIGVLSTALAGVLWRIPEVREHH